MAELWQTELMRLGIVGAGGMGNVHARHGRNIPSVETSLFDLQPEKASTVADRWQVGTKDSFDELLAWADIVDLCVPTPLHCDLGLRVLAAGKALFVEKPIAGSLEDGLKLIRAAEAANVPLMPGHVVRFFPEFAKGHEMVASGQLGTPAAARLRRGGGMPKGEHLWFSDHKQSGGVLLDLAIHDFDWLRWTLGEVREVMANSLGAKAGSGPDYALTTLQFDSGAVAHVEATWMDPGGFRVAYEVCGTAGMIEYDSRNVQTLRTTLDGSAPAFEAPLGAFDDPYYKELSGFVEAVKTGSTPPITGYDGLMALSIALAAMESAATVKPVAPARSL